MDISGRIKRSVRNRADAVLVRSDFAEFGSAAQVSRALRELLTDGTLLKIGLGVYAKTKTSVLSGKPIPMKPLEVLAPEALKKLGIEIGPSRLVQEYNAGKSTHIPAGIVLDTGRRRISRKLSYNGSTVQYERA
jgi:hypothetical protein